MSSIIRRSSEASNLTRPTVGDSKFSFIDLDHTGWIKCDGRLVNVADFNNLFKVIGYAFGGSGSQFKLPDMRGRVPGAANPGGARIDDEERNLSIREKGDYTGEEVHLLNINEMPSHKHGTEDMTGNNNGNGNTSTDGNHNHGGSTGNAGDAKESERVGFSVAGGPLVSGGDDHSHTISYDGDHFHTIKNTGGGNVHNNMQPTLFIGNAFIYTGRPNYGAHSLTLDTPVI